MCSRVISAVQYGASAEEIAAAVLAVLPKVGAGRLTVAAALIWPVGPSEVTGASPAHRLGE
jgi:hypothetical protein